MQYLLMSRDRGDTWEMISPDLTYDTAAEMGDIPYHTIFSISESPLRFGLIYVGTDDGKVHVTRDGGKTWTEIMAGLPYQKWVSRIVASAFDLGTVYMTQNGKRDDDFTPYVWKSTDFGKTWTSIAANIPIGPVNVIREDPVNKDILYVGTDTGVYVTTDGGEDVEHARHEPAGGLRARPGHPPARQRDGDRHARPGDVGARRRADQQEVDAPAPVLRGLILAPLRGVISAADSATVERRAELRDCWPPAGLPEIRHRMPIVRGGFPQALQRTVSISV